MWAPVRGILAGAVAIGMALALAAPVAAGTPYAKGDVFAGVGAGKIKVFKPDGTLVQTLDNTTGSGEQSGMCFDNLGNLYSANFTVNGMSKFDSSGNLLSASWGTGFNSQPESCVFDYAGHVFAGQAQGGHAILEFDTTGASLGSWVPALESRGTDWIELGPDGCTMYYTSEGTLVKRYNVCTSTQLPDFASGLPRPCYALRLRPNGEMMVACAGQAVRLDATGAQIQSYPAAGFTPAATLLFALNLDPDDASFWTGDYYTGDVYRIDIATGNQITHFNAGILGYSMSGLAVFGEITGIGPTPTPGPTQPPRATPTPTATMTPTPIPRRPIPATSGRGLAVFVLLLLATGGFLLWRRTP